MKSSCRGFRFGAVACGIKNKQGALDLAMIAADSPCDAAAVFTRNRIVAAPVKLSRAVLSRTRGKVQAVIVNSGNANACTGARGTADARKTAALAAEALGVRRDRVLVASTGVIGQPLPMDRVGDGVHHLGSQLRRDGFAAFAEGILTTDRTAKVARRSVTLGGQRITLLGCTKGAGMIAPNMATTLSFVVTDARVPATGLDAALRAATAATFNAITVDGDTSTNDMILIMASGAAGNRTPFGTDAARFTETLTDLLDELAHKLMREGEGVHHVVTVVVRGARSPAAAQKVARSIANSPLVKTAIAGRDPNWGRIMCAVGNAKTAVTPERVGIWFDRVKLVEGGVLVSAAREAAARKVMSRPEYTVTVEIGGGDGEARYLACDLSHEYVTINADYRT